MKQTKFTVCQDIFQLVSAQNTHEVLGLSGLKVNKVRIIHIGSKVEGFEGIMLPLSESNPDE